jgi:hypothetical protein
MSACLKCALILAMMVLACELAPRYVWLALLVILSLNLQLCLEIGSGAFSGEFRLIALHKNVRLPKVQDATCLGMSASCCI